MRKPTRSGSVAHQDPMVLTGKEGLQRLAAMCKEVVSVPKHVVAAREAKGKARRRKRRRS